MRDEVAVTPLAGVWVEILYMEKSQTLRTVTPLAGVWVEIEKWRDLTVEYMSLPSRECGLK